MRYTNFEFLGKEYKLRVTASATTELEKKLGGENPLNVLMAMEQGKLPPLTSVLFILHASMQKFHHGVTTKDVMEMYDDFVDSGHTYTDLIPVLIEVFRVSGFFKKPPEEEVQTGNL